MCDRARSRFPHAALAAIATLESAVVLLLEDTGPARRQDVRRALADLRRSHGDVLCAAASAMRPDADRGPCRCPVPPPLTGYLPGWAPVDGPTETLERRDGRARMFWDGRLWQLQLRSEEPAPGDARHVWLTVNHAHETREAAARAASWLFPMRVAPAFHRGTPAIA